jgi:hypothetical protein
MNQWEREEQQLVDDYASGFLTQREFNDQLGQLQREMRDQARAEAQDAAEQAYDDAMARW